MNKICEDNSFVVADIDADGQFECLVDEIEGVRVDFLYPLGHSNVV